MKTIYKYSLSIGSSSIYLPESATILDIQHQDGSEYLSIWCLIDTDRIEPDYRYFEVYATGQEIPEPDRGKSREYIATVQVDGLVWHVFETVTLTKRIP